MRARAKDWERLGKTGVVARFAARLGQGPRRRRCRRPLSSTREGPASDEASRESLGVTFTEAEEKDRIRQVLKLLYSGGDIDDAVREGVENGSIDRKTLAVLHRKVRTETERSSGESGVEGVEDGDEDGIGGGAALRRALSSLYDKILREYQKQNLSPSMKLLGECLDVLLEEDDDETERLLGVKRLLDERFVRADLGLDPISAARLFAEAETNASLQREIDSYLDERTQREAFVEEVQLRLRTLEQEFQQQAPTREEDQEGEDWIDRVERDNLIKARKIQQDQILKYLGYILELASSV